MTELKTLAVLIVVLGLFAAGAGWTAQRVFAQKTEEPKPRAQASKAETAAPAREDYYGDPLPPGTVARMGSVQLRHLRAHIAFAADGKTLISAGPDRRVCSWDVESGRLLRTMRVRPLMPHGFLYYSDATLSGNGSFLALHDGQSIYVHDVATGKERGQIPDARYMGVHFQFSPDGKTLALLPVKPRDIIRLWDVAAGKQRAVLKHPSVLRNCAFSADGRLLVSLTGDGLFRLWDVSTGRELRNVRADVRGLAFSPDGNLLATSDNWGVVSLWETATLQKRATLRPSPRIDDGSYPSEPLGLTFSPDGTLLAVAGNEALVLWDVAERKERRRLPAREARCLAFAPDGEILASASEVEIRLWDVASGRQLHQRPGHDGEVSSVSVSPDGKILASGHWYNPLRLWDAVTGKPLSLPPTGRLCPMNSIFSADGKWFFCAGEGNVQFWDAATGKKGRRFVVEDLRGVKGNHAILEVVHSPDGRRLTALSAHDNRLQLSVWDVQTGQSIARRLYRGSTMPFAYTSVLSPDGMAAIALRIEQQAAHLMQDNGILTLEDTATGQPLLTRSRNLGHPLTFSADGKLLAAGIHRLQGMERGYQVKSVSVIETATGEEVLRLDGPLEPLVFSPDGRFLASIDAVGDGGLRLWDVATGQRLFRRAWPDDAVRHPGWSPAKSLAFFPDSRRLATGMEDGTVLVWDLAPETWPKTGIAQHLDSKQLDAAWSDLAGDARKAHRTIYTLAASPKQALPFLAEHLRQPAAVDAKRVEKLLADLDSEQFAVREAAAKELTDIGSQIEPKLRRVLNSKPSLEVRNRLLGIQEKLRGVPPAATLQRLRAIRVLEMIGTAEARRQLRKFADGPEGARATSAAKAALQRLTSHLSPSR